MIQTSENLITVPVPTTFAEAVWLMIGATFGRGFGKQLDQEIQNSDWFKRLSPFWQSFVKRLLDCMHHWWMGALLMIWATEGICTQTYPPYFIVRLTQFLLVCKTEFYWFGAGLLLDDLPDVWNRFKKYFEYKKLFK